MVARPDPFHCAWAAQLFGVECEILSLEGLIIDGTELFGYSVRQRMREGHRFLGAGMEDTRAYGAVKPKVLQNYRVFSEPGTELLRQLTKLMQQ